MFFTSRQLFPYLAMQQTFFTLLDKERGFYIGIVTKQRWRDKNKQKMFLIIIPHYVKTMPATSSYLCTHTRSHSWNYWFVLLGVQNPGENRFIGPTLGDNLNICVVP